MRNDPADSDAPQGETHYFSVSGYVIERSERREVFVGGSLIGWFVRGDVGVRNILIIAASRAIGVDRGKLANAFGVSLSTVASIRRRFKKRGLNAIIEKKQGGREQKLTKKLQARLDKLFDEGLMIDDAHERIRRCVSRTLVGRAHKCWVDSRSQQQSEVRTEPEAAQNAPAAATGIVVARERRAPIRAAITVGPVDDGKGYEQGHGDGAADTLWQLTPLVIESEQPVQHLGCWVMLAMLQALGIYAYAELLRKQAEIELAAEGKGFMKAETLRAAIDAVAISLTLGQMTVEGVRRIATSSARLLLRLRGKGSMSASWARRILGRFAARSAGIFRMALATNLVQQSEHHASEAKRVVFYVDNHARPYTGKHTIRKSWQMQAKRALPGNADFWVHDEDGRPVLRVDSPEHESLTQVLRPIGRLIRTALKDEKNVIVVLVFDRAGAYPQEMGELRDEEFEFATYERKPHGKLSSNAFQHRIELRGASYGLAEVGQKNLGKGRGRVRRVVLQTPEGKQVNLLAVSEASAQDVVQFVTRRWACQENQFKRGVERWGINQLDGRAVEPYPGDSIIPNPARARVERAMRLARAVEGDAMRRLQTLDVDDPKRGRVQKDLERARFQQKELQEVRPKVPTHAPVKDTELSGELMRHKQEYKHTVDAIRIALANADAELAARLAPLLPRPAEAKRTLANLLCAPGTVTADLDTIKITLSPAGTSIEHRAFQQFLAQLNELPLSLPGDLGQRRLLFQLPSIGQLN
jgi:hypothetical protein